MSANTLYDVPVGEHATVAGTMVDAALDRRLRELGLRVGADVAVMQKTSMAGWAATTERARRGLSHWC
ncbi:FeoA family protein [Corynebacterium aquatimens]|uniref:Fe2+ transport system protein FeoA n=1 Tax=Corynebacterium aquatimens TaxID=1190508 RepID=A0A931E1B2_9CORY|nr:FeoA family protein [Corynebacterium aquatimens]MBG6122423.1 Fe2+ transport system protein FeoA [Corynebacterium aquatimens]WJY65037.1 FeoA domain protein [Corynebacterium aquatimens]